MKHELRAEFWLPADLKDVWAYFGDANKLKDLSPDFYHAEVLGDAETKEGNIIHLQINPFGLGIKLKWDSLIESVKVGEDECSFVDVQQKGPFKYWRHTHSFKKGPESISDVKMKQPGTWCYDHVVYELPIDLFSLANQLVVKRMLSSMFVYRQKVMRKDFQ